MKDTGASSKLCQSLPREESPACGDASDHQFSLSLPKKFSRLQRASEIFANPKIIVDLNWRTVKQRKVEDCSVISALIVCANYEERFPHREPLISRSIHPQDGAGRPKVSSGGQYEVKLHLNGRARMVSVDDLLPVGSNGELLCSQTFLEGELWVSLMEKAYLQVGIPRGYGLRGSKGDYDLHAFTGWIPERINLSSYGGSVPADKEQVFLMLHEGLRLGHALVIAATTGSLTKGEARSTGLRPRHSYALLEVRIVDELKLLKLKNPWARQSWMGQFSPFDLTSWTPKLEAILNVELVEDRSLDNGIFWIKYEDFCDYFDIFYVNWNPAKLPHSCHKLLHLSPSLCQERKEDGDVSRLPQYLLQVDDDQNSTEVWILVMRHVEDLVDFEVHKEYITFALYANGGERMRNGDDPSVIFDGYHLRRNPSHYFLAKQTLQGGEKYTVVILHRSGGHVQGTLSCYSTAKVTLERLVEE